VVKDDVMAIEHASPVCPRTLQTISFSLLMSRVTRARRPRIFIATFTSTIECLSQAPPLAIAPCRFIWQRRRRMRDVLLSPSWESFTQTFVCSENCGLFRWL